jgi:alpha-L-rhamnosidase
MKRWFVFVLAASVSYMCVAGAPRWISGDTAAPEKPAPVLLKEFVLDAKPKKAVFTVAVAGWCEVRVNGEKVGRDVLSPVTCQPDKRTSSLGFDVTDMLAIGTNRFEVLLGNGWQNTFTMDAWGFANAPWIGSPKIRGELVCDGRALFVTDSSWRAYDSPIVFNALRNGEWYDARREGRRINERPVRVEKYVPWGIVSPEVAAPCRVFEALEPKSSVKMPLGNIHVYDFGANISGWCEIEVEGEAGAMVKLDYDESVNSRGSLLGYIKEHTAGKGEKRPVQHDEYTLAGRKGGEKWHPRFAYHGFRYVQVEIRGKARLKSIRAQFVHSAFDRVGRLETSHATFAALQDATERSFLSNFVGIPTDCPHREKNGWTGDAQLAMETGLWNFEAKASYIHFLRMMLDAQRPNGAVPCILPCTPKFGFGWGSGPAWDAVLFEIPWQIYRFYGDDAPAREAYEAMKRYLGYISTQVGEDGLYAYGLGDWANWYKDRPGTPVSFTDSAYVYQFNRRLAFWADRFGEKDFAAKCTAAAERIKAAFNKAFYKGDGLYGEGRLTELAAPLFFKGLCADGEEEKVAKRLAGAVRAKNHRAHFGILGAKWTPRVLAEYGYADDAYLLFVQPDMPGWAHWLESGHGTLHEEWDDVSSLNHILFGDLSAWAYEYAAGIVPLEPGFRKIAFRPHVLKGVDSFIATHKTPFGEIKAGWRRGGGKVEFVCEAPEGVEAIKSYGGNENED